MKLGVSHTWEPAILQQKCFESAALLSSGPSTCAKTPVNTADRSFENAFVGLRKSGSMYSGPMRTNGVFIPEESVTLPYLSGLIWINRINPKPKITQNKQTKDLATSPETE